MSISNHFDVAIIGAGIAGASVAAELASQKRVAILEMENQPGYHTTGRSAAIYAATYGPPPIRALTRASRAFFDNPGLGFSAGPILSSRGILMIARGDQEKLLDDQINELAGEAPVERLSPEEVMAHNPLLKPEYVAAGFHDPTSSDIDVNALHRGYLNSARNHGATFFMDSPARGLDHFNEQWQLETDNSKLTADIVVNAAGAWADQIGQLAGAMRIGLVPKRRTAMLISDPKNRSNNGLPLTIDCEEQFYLKPDAGKLLISPADETPSEPCDAQPEELDIAICADRVSTAFDLDIRRIENKWAGLRSFVDDKCPVCGFDPDKTGFFWLAGQGGYGIQSSPALARYAASVVLGEAPPADILDEGFDPAQVSPERLI